MKQILITAFLVLGAVSYNGLRAQISFTYKNKQYTISEKYKYYNDYNKISYYHDVQDEVVFQVYKRADNSIAVIDMPINLLDPWSLKKSSYKLPTQITLYNATNLSRQYPQHFYFHTEKERDDFYKLIVQSFKTEDRDKIKDFVSAADLRTEEAPADATLYFVSFSGEILRSNQKPTKKENTYKSTNYTQSYIQFNAVDIEIFEVISKNTGQILNVEKFEIGFEKPVIYFDKANLDIYLFYKDKIKAVFYTDDRAAVPTQKSKIKLRFHSLEQANNFLAQYKAYDIMADDFDSYITYNKSDYDNLIVEESNAESELTARRAANNEASAKQNAKNEGGILTIGNTKIIKYNNKFYDEEWNEILSTTGASYKNSSEQVYAVKENSGFKQTIFKNNECIFTFQNNTIYAGNGTSSKIYTRTSTELLEYGSKKATVQNRSSSTMSQFTLIDMAILIDYLSL